MMTPPYLRGIELHHFWFFVRHCVAALLTWNAKYCIICANRGLDVLVRNLERNDMAKRMQSEARKADKTVARKAMAGRPAYVMDGRGFVHVAL